MRKSFSYSNLPPRFTPLDKKVEMKPFFHSCGFEEENDGQANNLIVIMKL